MSPVAAARRALVVQGARDDFSRGLGCVESMLQELCGVSTTPDQLRLYQAGCWHRMSGYNFAAAAAGLRAS